MDDEVKDEVADDLSSLLQGGVVVLRGSVHFVQLLVVLESQIINVAGQFKASGHCCFRILEVALTLHHLGIHLVDVRCHGELEWVHHREVESLTVSIHHSRSVRGHHVVALVVHSSLELLLLGEVTHHEDGLSEGRGWERHVEQTLHILLLLLRHWHGRRHSH